MTRRIAVLGTIVLTEILLVVFFGLFDDGPGDADPAGASSAQKPAAVIVEPVRLTS